MRARPLLISAAAAGLVVCGAGLDHAFAAKSASPGKYRHVYKLDYALTATTPNHAPETTTLMTEVEDGPTADVRAGANVPLETAPGGMASPRQDVGLRIKGAANRVGNDVLVQFDLELSGADDRPTTGARVIRKIASTGTALLSFGKQTVVAVVEEPTTHAHYELAITATQLR